MTRVIIVDDNENFRKGLKAVLNNMEQTEIIGEASNGKEFLDILSKSEADLVFMDVKMPIVDGIQATIAAKSAYPKLIIYAFSSFENEEYKKSMMEAGANGYLCKSQDNYEMLNNIIKKQNINENERFIKTTKNYSHGN